MYGWLSSLIWKYVDIKEQKEIWTSADTQVHSWTRYLEEAKFEKIAYEDFVDTTLELLHALKAVFEDVSVTDAQKKAAAAEEILVEQLNSPEVFNAITIHVRFLTSAYIKTHVDEFAPFVIENIHECEDITAAIDLFCSREVEAMGHEADHIMINALALLSGVSFSSCEVSFGGHGLPLDMFRSI